MTKPMDAPNIINFATFLDGKTWVAPRLECQINAHKGGSMEDVIRGRPLVGVAVLRHNRTLESG